MTVSIAGSDTTSHPRDQAANLGRALLDAIADPALAQAARRVLAAAAWRPDALAAGEVAEQLVHLCRAIEQREPGRIPEASSFGQTILRRRLLTLLRAELVAGWQADAQAVASTEILGTLDAIERIARTLEPDWRQQLSARLGEPEAMEFVVEVAHDLRSPLTSIMFLSETLRNAQSGPVNDLQRQQLGIVYSAALGLISVVSDVIDMARAGDALDSPAPLSLAELFESVRAIVAPMAEEKRLALRILPPENDLRIGNYVPLARVLLNLVTNAIKFTEEGYVQVVAVEQGKSRVKFSVRDTGRGFDSDQHHGLYQPFMRRPDRSGFHFSGTGLGLAISRRMVEALGGELHVETRKNWGTSFWFELELPPANRFDSRNLDGGRSRRGTTP